jgi:uncharacterized protein (DUF58 family)
VRRFLRPPRRLKFTREGRYFFFISLGIGFAAVNTGNNLLYLLQSMLLGLVVTSGVLSERSIRRVRLALGVPDEIFAGRPALFTATVVNGKRRATSYSLTIEIRRPGMAPRRLHVPRLGPGEERLLTWVETLPRRGRHRLPGARLVTLFPFSLFRKAGPTVLDADLIVYPAIGPAPPDTVADQGGAGATRRWQGRGAELYNLRDYRWGDDPRLIHWRSSAKAGAPLVRELEAEVTTDTRIVLEPTGGGDRLEAGLGEAATLARHLLRAGASVELVGPGLHMPIGRGRRHERALLTALALYEPGVGRPRPAPPARREVRIAI